MRLKSAVVGVAILATACGVSPPKSRFPTADAAIGRLRATLGCVNGVQGRAKIDRFSKAGRVRGEVYLFAANPAQVRFDVVSPFGATLYTLTSDGHAFQMLDTKDSRFLFGPAKSCNLARLTQVPVPGHALVALLQGDAPVLVHGAAGATISWDTAGVYRLLIQSSHSASEEIRIAVHPDDFDKEWGAQRLRLSGVRVWQAGVELYDASLEHYEAAKTALPRLDADGIDPPVLPSGPACFAEAPRSIRMRVPNTEDEVTLQYKEVSWNPPLVEGVFSQVAPASVPAVRVDCADP